MKCDICQEKPATVHLTEIVNDQMRQIHLCEPCAKEKGVKMEGSFGMGDLLSGLADLNLPTEGGTTKPIKASCSKCGMSFEEFKKSGRLGCGSCYEAFEPQLTQLLSRIHGAKQHTGRTPKVKVVKMVKRRGVSAGLKLEELKKQLGAAIQAEAFEEAAKLRDQIRKLESKAGGKAKPSGRRARATKKSN